MRHQEYLDHLEKHIRARSDDKNFLQQLKHREKEYNIIVNLNFDPVIDILESLYSPVKYGDRRDAVCMLRSFILMTLFKFTSITKWVAETKYFALYAVLAGFEPDDPPGVGTYYDFLDRMIDGPYRKPCQCNHQVRRSKHNKGEHKRSLKKEKEDKKALRDGNHSQSEKLVEKLLENADSGRPDDFNKILEDLLFQLGIIPSIQEGLISDLDNLIVSGDGSIMRTAASAQGSPTCTCRSEGIYKCDHERYYTSPTAEFCYDHIHNCFIFGDRYYHLVVSQDGHDFPLHTHMPGGNESDYTLSLTSVDRFMKAAGENGLDIEIVIFCGDGHHDSYAHYNYFLKKGIIPVIPLTTSGKTVYPHLPDNNNVRLDTDGTPLCPGGCRMRHHTYNKKKMTHVFSCPAKRHSHQDGESVYIFHEEDCPYRKDCKPDSSLGPFVYIKTETDPRLFPPIPRTSKKFQEIMNQRSASERCNFVNDTYNLDRCHRNADYGTIRLILANICHHASIRYTEAKKSGTLKSVFDKIRVNLPNREYEDSG
jgi:hypothetical protein